MDWNIILGIFGVVVGTLGVIVGACAIRQAHKYENASKIYNSEARRIQEQTYIASLYSLIEARAIVSRGQDVIRERDKIVIEKTQHFKKENADTCIGIFEDAGKIKRCYIEKDIRKFLLDENKTSCDVSLRFQVGHENCNPFVSMCDRLIKQGISIFLYFE